MRSAIGRSCELTPGSSEVPPYGYMYPLKCTVDIVQSDRHLRGAQEVAQTVGQ